MVISHIGLDSRSLILIAPDPGHCALVPGVASVVGGEPPNHLSRESLNQLGARLVQHVIVLFLFFCTETSDLFFVYI